MKNIFKKNKKQKTLAVSQIISIVLSTIAFAYIIGSEFGTVSADELIPCVTAANSEWRISGTGYINIAQQIHWEIGDSITGISGIYRGRTHTVDFFCNSFLPSLNINKDAKCNPVVTSGLITGMTIRQDQIHSCPATTPATTTPTTCIACLQSNMQWCVSSSGSGRCVASGTCPASSSSSSGAPDISSADATLSCSLLTQTPTPTTTPVYACIKETPSSAYRTVTVPQGSSPETAAQYCANHYYDKCTAGRCPQTPTRASAAPNILTGQCVIINGVQTRITSTDENVFCRSLSESDRNSVCAPGSINIYYISATKVQCTTTAQTEKPAGTPIPAVKAGSEIIGVTGAVVKPAIDRVGKTVSGGISGIKSSVAGAIETKGAETAIKTTSGTIAGVIGSVKWTIANAGAALAIYGTTKFVLGQIGASPELQEAAGRAVGGGYFVAALGHKLGFAKLLGAKLGISTGLATWGIGFGIGIAIFVLTYKSTRYDGYTFTCYPWDAPVGGKDCEKCNSGDLPCTEYRCKSLGQACELQNPGTTEELCVWKNRNDVTPPQIEAWTNTLTIGYKYIPDTAISPPDRGVKIVPTNNNTGCIESYTALRFGVTLNEAAKCKIDTANKENFDDMRWFFDLSSTSKYNHSQTMSLPSIEALEAENITIENNGKISLYAKCQDANGNANKENFVFKFCVNKGPDNTQPLIVSTSILNGMPIGFNTTSVDLSVYVNEPAECKWSKTDQNYNSMETNMSCSTSVVKINAQGLYRCSTTLTGLNDGVDNNFYFRCKDQPHLGVTNESRRNVNSQSYKFTLKGTQPLVIDSVKPNGTIKDSTDLIKVTLEAKTSAGFHEGDSTCTYNGTGTNNQFIEFFATGTYEHSQDLYLAEDDYTYNIQCTDLGGNSDTDSVKFRVESDSEAPIVVRAFHEGNYLKIVTNEEASCVYSTSNSLECNYEFDQGETMQSLENNKHQISWNSDKTFYIKCEDEFGNPPLPNECSIIARPYAIK